MTGKTFGELIHNFIVVRYETCFMACAQGTINVVASVSKTKHKKKDRKYREYIMLYCTRNINRKTGTNLFVMKGVRY